MKKLVKYNEKTKQCSEVFEGTDIKWAKAIGYIEQDIEYSYDGTPYIMGYAPVKPFNELKAEKREEINKARDETEQGGFEYMGKVFDSDQISCQRISTAAQALQFMDLNKSGSVPVITWTCADNSKIDLTTSDLAGLVIALMEHSNTCHQKATRLKTQIENATSEEELEQIKW